MGTTAHQLVALAGSRHLGLNVHTPTLALTSPSAMRTGTLSSHRSGEPRRGGRSLSHIGGTPYPPAEAPCGPSTREAPFSAVGSLRTPREAHYSAHRAGDPEPYDFRPWCSATIAREWRTERDCDWRSRRSARGQRCDNGELMAVNTAPTFAVGAVACYVDVGPRIVSP